MSARVRIRAALCLALAIANSGPAHAADVHTTATPGPAAPDPGADPCAPYAGQVAAWLQASREVAKRQAALDALRTDPVEFQLTQCKPSSYPGSCTLNQFDREREIAKAKADLQTAEAQLTDAEDAARQAGAPDRCLVDPDD